MNSDGFDSFSTRFSRILLFFFLNLPLTGCCCWFLLSPWASAFRGTKKPDNNNNNNNSNSSNNSSNNNKNKKKEKMETKEKKAWRDEDERLEEALRYSWNVVERHGPTTTVALVRALDGRPLPSQGLCYRVFFSTGFWNQLQRPSDATCWVHFDQTCSSIYMNCTVYFMAWLCNHRFWVNCVT